MCQTMVQAAVTIEQEWGETETTRNLMNHAELLYEQYGPFELELKDYSDYSSLVPMRWYNE